MRQNRRCCGITGRTPPGPIADGGTAGSSPIALVDAGALIQSNFEGPGNFEVVVPEPDGLAHYWHDNADVTSPFLCNGHHRARIDRTWDRWCRTARTATSKSGAARRGAAPLLARRLRMASLGRNHGAGDRTGLSDTETYWDNLELVVLEGSELVHYFRDESEATRMKWRFGAIVTDKATGPAGFAQGRGGCA